MFSCEFCKIFENTFFTEHLRATAYEVTNSVGSFMMVNRGNLLMKWNGNYKRHYK